MFTLRHASLESESEAKSLPHFSVERATREYGITECYSTALSRGK